MLTGIGCGWRRAMRKNSEKFARSVGRILTQTLRGKNTPRGEKNHAKITDEPVIAMPMHIATAYCHCLFPLSSAIADCYCMEDGWAGGMGWVGVQVFKCSSVQVFKYSSVQMFKCSKVQKMGWIHHGPLRNVGEWGCRTGGRIG